MKSIATRSNWVLLCVFPLCLSFSCGSFSFAAAPIRVGVIGLDTSHAPAFIKMLNDPKAALDVAGFRVVAAYPQGSKDIQSSVKRVPEYTKQVKALGVEIVDSIDELLKRVDVVLLETNDGRPHPGQVLPVLKAGKPVFVDKPVAGSLVDVIRIFEAAEHFKTPIFSSSALRYTNVPKRFGPARSEKWSRRKRTARASWSHTIRTCSGTGFTGSKLSIPLWAPAANPSYERLRRLWISSSAPGRAAASARSSGCGSRGRNSKGRNTAARRSA